MQLCNRGVFMKKYTTVFKALSDITRLRIVNLLCHSGIELCVCEFVDSIEESQYNISRHLKVLKNAGLVMEKKEGRWVRYELFKDDSTFTKAVFQAVSGIPEKLIAHDRKELLKRLEIRVKGKCLIGIQKKQFMTNGGSHEKK